MNAAVLINRTVIVALVELLFVLGLIVVFAFGMGIRSGIRRRNKLEGDTEHARERRP